MAKEELKQVECTKCKKGSKFFLTIISGAVAYSYDCTKCGHRNFIKIEKQQTA